MAKLTEQMLHSSVRIMKGKLNLMEVLISKYWALEELDTLGSMNHHRLSKVSLG